MARSSAHRGKALGRACSPGLWPLWPLWPSGASWPHGASADCRPGGAIAHAPFVAPPPTQGKTPSPSPLLSLFLHSQNKYGIDHTCRCGITDHICVVGYTFVEVTSSAWRVHSTTPLDPIFLVNLRWNGPHHTCATSVLSYKHDKDQSVHHTGDGMWNQCGTLEICSLVRMKLSIALVSTIFFTRSLPYSPYTLTHPVVRLRTSFVPGVV